VRIKILAAAIVALVAGTIIPIYMLTYGRANQSQTQTALDMSGAGSCLLRLDDSVKGFAFKMYRAVLERYGLRNLVLSPYNIYEALLMLYEGSNGTTRAEIGRALGIDPECSVWDAYRELRSTVINGSGAATLDLGSGIWINATFYRAMRQEYVDNLRRYFQSVAREFPTLNELVDDVNSYVENKTRGLIKRIMELEYVDERTAVVLLTTLYFNASWEEPFEPIDMAFTSIDGSEKLVKGMERSGEFYVYEGEDVIAVLIPYNNSNYGLLIIMPKNTSEFGDYTKKLNPDVVRGIVGGMSKVRVRLVMPKFEVETKMDDAEEVLRSLGIREAFEPYIADLTRMAHVKRGDLYVDRVIHAAKIRVYEEGTEAAAATAIIIKVTASIDERTVVIDKPFIFMVIDMNNLIPIFIGQVTTL